MQSSAVINTRRKHESQSQLHCQKECTTFDNRLVYEKARCKGKLILYSDNRPRSKQRAGGRRKCAWLFIRKRGCLPTRDHVRPSTQSSTCVLENMSDMALVTFQGLPEYKSRVMPEPEELTQTGFFHLVPSTKCSCLIPNSYVAWQLKCSVATAYESSTPHTKAPYYMSVLELGGVMGAVRNLLE